MSFLNVQISAQLSPAKSLTSEDDGPANGSFDSADKDSSTKHTKAQLAERMKGAADDAGASSSTTAGQQAVFVSAPATPPNVKAKGKKKMEGADMQLESPSKSKGSPAITNRTKDIMEEIPARLRLSNDELVELTIADAWYFLLKKYKRVSLANVQLEQQLEDVAAKLSSIMTDGIPHNV